MTIHRRATTLFFTLLALAVVIGAYVPRMRVRAEDARRYEIGWATYLGGSEWDQAREVIPCADGSILVGAQTSSEDIVTTDGVAQPQYAGDDPNLGHPGVYGGDCYLARLSADGARVLAATYFGGSKQERNVYGMELDGDGNVVITSTTRSSDIPTTEGCFQPKYGGGQADCFAAKLTPDLRQVIWCTYVGGSGDESPRGGLAIHQTGNVCLFCTTGSPDYPTTAGAYRTERKGARDAAVTSLRSDGSDLAWGTLFGGSGRDYMLGGRIDQSGNVFFAGHTTSVDLPGTAGAAQATHGGGHDTYVVKLSDRGSHVEYATYIGGNGNEFPEHRLRIAVDGSVLVPGVSASADFPTTRGAAQRNLKGENDSFLTRLSPDGSEFVFSTLLGGSGGEFCLMPTFNSEGNIIVVGQTESRDLPVTADAVQSSYGGGRTDGWLAVLSADGSTVLYCTYIGGSSEDMVRSVAIAPEGGVYLVGHTMSADFPVTEGAVQAEYGGKGDAYVMRLVPGTGP